MAFLECPVCGQPGVENTGHATEYGAGEECGAGLPGSGPSWQEGDTSCINCGAALTIDTYDGVAFLYEAEASQ